MYDYIIRNGHVIDPASGTDEKQNIAVQDGRIVKCRDGVAAHHTIDAQGYFVSPGFIDFHTHVYPGSTFYVKHELLFASGVTGLVDAGTTGICNFEDFYRKTITSSMQKVKAYLNISSVGQPGGGIEESLDPGLFDEKGITRLFRQYPDTLLGLKIRFSRHLVKEHGITPFMKTLELARRLNTAVCVHTTDPPMDAAELVSLLDKDDIYCHVFQGHGSTIIGEDGILKEAFWLARKRGVIFDGANGRMNFDFSVAMPALKNGFWPDVISTDLTSLSFNMPGLSPVKTLPFIMSKYLSLGMALPDLIRSVTETPARLMRLEGENGTLREGARADVTLFRIENKSARFIDSASQPITGNKLIIPVLTMADGKILFNGEYL